MDIWEKSCFLHCVHRHRTWRWILPGNTKKQSYPMFQKKSLKVIWTPYWAVTVSSDRQSLTTKRALTESGSLPKARAACTRVQWACPAVSGRVRTGTRETRTAGPAARQSRGTQRSGLTTTDTETDDLWLQVTHGHIQELRSSLPHTTNHRK